MEGFRLRGDPVYVRADVRSFGLLRGRPHRRGQRLEDVLLYHPAAVKTHHDADTDLYGKIVSYANKIDHDKNNAEDYIENIKDIELYDEFVRVRDEWKKIKEEEENG